MPRKWWQKSCSNNDDISNNQNSLFDDEIKNNFDKQEEENKCSQGCYWFWWWDEKDKNIISWLIHSQTNHAAASCIDGLQNADIFILLAEKRSFVASQDSWGSTNIDQVLAEKQREEGENCRSRIIITYRWRRGSVIHATLTQVLI